MARPFNQDITIYSNGPPPTDEPTQKALKKVLATGVKLDERKVHRFMNNGEGPENGISVEFETGDPARLGMLLHRPPTRNRGQDLFAQLGLGTKPNGDVITDPMKLGTNVPGCVAAGDTQESIKQAVMAAGNGENPSSLYLVTSTAKTNVLILCRASRSSSDCFRTCRRGGESGFGRTGEERGKPLKHCIGRLTHKGIGS